MKLNEEWYGEVPEKCQLCGSKIESIFIDGKTNLATIRSWACMCPTCHGEVGDGLGMGHGQRYERRDGVFVLAEGVEG